MTRTAFEQQLTEIQEDMLALADMVEAAIERGSKRCASATWRWRSRLSLMM